MAQRPTGGLFAVGSFQVLCQSSAEGFPGQAVNAVPKHPDFGFIEGASQDNRG
jgi:hypothetical protein